MEAADLKAAIVSGIFQSIERIPDVVSTSIVGSFSERVNLADVADIDTILVARRLDRKAFSLINQVFADVLEPLLAKEGLKLRINPTLGPLKFNDAETAVLHLMIYTCETHRTHVVKSPFTCLDWQRSPLWHGQRLSDVYPTFRLQPHHFIGARRGAQDYLADLKADVVSYRTLNFEEDEGYREVKEYQPMDDRSRSEFAFHVMRFLMQNLLKLIRRNNQAEEGEQLLSSYFSEFDQGAEDFARFYRDLSAKKRQARFRPPIPNLVARTTSFVVAFENQFRSAFERNASQHILFRHEATEWNGLQGDEVVFQGETDLPIREERHGEWGVLVDSIKRAAPSVAFVSSRQRTAQSLQLLDRAGRHMPKLDVRVDDRLDEIRYGLFEGRTVSEARREFPDLFEGWSRGEDRQFPGGGENSNDVLTRVQSFVRDNLGSGGSTVACTHNVVLRCLVGNLMGVPPSEWHRLQIPHMAPISLVCSDRYGLFIDLEESVERDVFAKFFMAKNNT
jgi:probable phosphoglycerate mutase